MVTPAEVTVRGSKAVSDYLVSCGAVSESDYSCALRGLLRVAAIELGTHVGTVSARDVVAGVAEELLYLDQIPAPNNQEIFNG